MPIFLPNEQAPTSPSQTNIVRLKQNAGNWRRPLSSDKNTALLLWLIKKFHQVRLSSGQDQEQIDRISKVLGWLMLDQYSNSLNFFFKNPWKVLKSYKRLL